MLDVAVCIIPDVFFQVNSAHKYGCKAAIFFSDPYDYAAPGETAVYPDAWWLPGTGAQRGTVKLVSGDPTTYMYPSLGRCFIMCICDTPVGCGLYVHVCAID